MKRTFQDVFAEGSVKDNQTLERLGTQRHERALGDQELKRKKLEQKTMEKQHQRERDRERDQHECERECEQHQRACEREQHEFRMLRMQLMILQNAHGAPTSMQPPNQPSFEGFGLMAELGDASILPSESSYSP
jgi:hypothetical protein